MMTIEELAQKLNKKAIADGFRIATLPELRKKHLGKEQLPAEIFTGLTIFGEPENYAFHHGGRKELQFNVGEENVAKKSVTRYGLCLSLQPSHGLANPEEQLDSLRRRFNECIKKRPELFHGFQMWYYEDGKRHDNVAPQTIPDQWFKLKNFIALGNLIEKPFARLSDVDLQEILAGFDKLLPIYEYCVLQRSSTPVKEDRITRLCWNLNGWVVPSGPQGKSQDKESHEYRFGFGHEEWLFDTGKVIDGYHYGFLEPVRKQQSAFENNSYNVWFYSIDGETKKRFLVGNVRGLEVISAEMAEEIKKSYNKNGWLDEMKDQLTSVGAKIGNLISGPGIDIFNVRYLPTNLQINEQYVELAPDNPLNGLSRYVFAELKQEFLVGATQKEFHFVESEESDSDDEGKLKTRKHLRLPKEVEITYLHEAIAKGLTKHLRLVSGKRNVGRENPTGQGGSRVDIVVKNGSEMTFYEIKTYNSARTSIREALGQLMEYSWWTHDHRARRLIVVTQPHDNLDEAQTYFKHLREKHGLPFYFQTYDFEKDVLSEVF